MALSPPLRPLEEGDWQQVHDIVLEVATARETYSMDVPGSVEETRAFWTGQHNEVVLDESGRVVGTSKMGPNHSFTGRRAVFPLAAFHGGRQGQCGFLTISNTVLSPCCLVKKPRASWRPSSVPSKPSRRGLPLDT